MQGTDTIKAYLVDNSGDEATSKGDALNIIVNVGTEEEMGSESEYDLSTYRTFEKILPNGTDTISLRVPFIDPTGEMTDLNIADVTSSLQGKASIEGEMLYYTAGSGSYIGIRCVVLKIQICVKKLNILSE
jgi:hypothetical protein